MRKSFEVFEQDIENVLYKNKVSLSDEKIESIFKKNIDLKAVEEAALTETEFDLQIFAAYNEIENQLKKIKVI